MPVIIIEFHLFLPGNKVHDSTSPRPSDAFVINQLVFLFFFSQGKTDRFHDIAL